MEITTQIDRVITNLNTLKPMLSGDIDANKREFNNILREALEQNQEHEAVSGEATWKDESFAFNPENPQKPNSRELIEALSGRTVEDLYADPDSNWQKFSRMATEILYGVVTSEDTRDWAKIMTSSNIISSAREETNKMHKPTVDIESVINSQSEIVEQYAVINDQYGNNLRSLTGNSAQLEDSLMNFGVSANSIPENIEAKVVVKDFDVKILNILKNISEKPSVFNSTIKETNLSTLAFESATNALARRLPDELSLEGFSKI